MKHQQQGIRVFRALNLFWGKSKVSRVALKTLETQRKHRCKYRGVSAHCIDENWCIHSLYHLQIIVCILWPHPCSGTLPRKHGLALSYESISVGWVNILDTLKSRWNGRQSADDIFELIFVSETYGILIKFSLKYVTIWIGLQLV